MARFLQSLDDCRDDGEFARFPPRRSNGFDATPFRHALTSTGQRHGEEVYHSAPPLRHASPRRGGIPPPSTPTGDVDDETDIDEELERQQAEDAEALLRAARRSAPPIATSTAQLMAQLRQERDASPPRLIDGASDGRARSGSRASMSVTPTGRVAVPAPALPLQTTTRMSSPRTVGNLCEREREAAVAELTAARQEIHRLLQTLGDSDAQVSRMREQTLADARAELTRQQNETRHRVDDIRAQYENRLEQSRREHETELAEIRQETRKIATEIAEQMRAETTKALADQQRQHRDEIQNLAARIPSVAAVTDTRLPSTVAESLEIQQLRAELAQLRSRVAAAPPPTAALADGVTPPKVVAPTPNGAENRATTTTPPPVPKHTVKKPFCFDGRAEMFQVWLTNFEKWSDSQGLTDEQRMQIMPGYIEGSVQLELGYDSLEAWPASYATFKEQLKQRYDGPGHIYSAELHNIRQDADESLKSFATRIAVAARKANRLVTKAPEPAQIELFITGLQNQTVAQFLMRKYQRDCQRIRDGTKAHMATLHDALEEALLCALPGTETEERTVTVAAEKTTKRSSTAKTAPSPCAVQAATPTESSMQSLNDKIEKLSASLHAVVNLAAVGPQAQSTAPPSMNSSFSSTATGGSSARGGFRRLDVSHITCFNCGQKGHMLKDCKEAPDAARIQRNRDERAAKRAQRDADRAAAGALNGAVQPNAAAPQQPQQKNA